MPISTVSQKGLDAPLSLTTPNLGTPSALVLTNATGTPAAINLTNATALPRTAMPSGSVIQTVEATRTSPLSYTTKSPTYTSFISGSITTTVANSKVLVMCNVPVYVIGSGTWAMSQYYQLLQGGVLAQQYEHAGAQVGGEFCYQWQFQFLSSALSVGTYTWSMQGAITDGSATVTIARTVSGNTTKVSLLMMEIAP